MHLLKKNIGLPQIVFDIIVDLVKHQELASQVIFETLGCFSNSIYDLFSVNFVHSGAEFETRKVSTHRDAARIEELLLLSWESWQVGQDSFWAEFTDVHIQRPMQVILQNYRIEKLVILPVAFVWSSIDANSGVLIAHPRHNCLSERYIIITDLILVLLPNGSMKMSRQSRHGRGIEQLLERDAVQIVRSHVDSYPWIALCFLIWDGFFVLFLSPLV